MNAALRDLLEQARIGSYAVGAFNVYNLEGALAVVRAAEQMESPVIVQLLPSALDLAGPPLAALCLKAAATSSVPVGVHLDHCSSLSRIRQVIACGITSIMADGSSCGFRENAAFTSSVVALTAAAGGCVEAELGWLGGEEDGTSWDQNAPSLTDPEDAARFVETTGAAALAVCIGNIHGPYRHPPHLDFALLDRIRQRVDVPLVLHGTSGLPDHLVEEAIARGISKFNVNTELRMACLEAMASCTRDKKHRELLPCMQTVIDAMQRVVCEKLILFRSAGRAAFTIQPNINHQEGETP